MQHLIRTRDFSKRRDNILSLMKQEKFLKFKPNEGKNNCNFVFENLQE